MQTIEDALRDVHGALTAIRGKALIVGGLAVARHGYARTTADIDLLMATNQAASLVRQLREAGYTNIVRRDVVTRLCRPEGAWVVDVLPADENTFSIMWRRAETVILADCEFRIPAVEDLIAMKIFALTHGGEHRESKDMGDIVSLAIANDLDLDARIRPLCERYGTNRVFMRIVEEYRRCTRG